MWGFILVKVKLRKMYGFMFYFYYQLAVGRMELSSAENHKYLPCVHVNRNVTQDRALMHHTSLPPKKPTNLHLSQHTREERVWGARRGVGGIMGSSKKGDSESMQKRKQAAATEEQL